MNRITDAELTTITNLVNQRRNQPGALLPILNDIQDQLGYIPNNAIPLIADALQQTQAEIQGVISFYHHFQTTPPGRHKIEVCRAEACQARGARELEKHVQTTLGMSYHQTTPDKAFSLEPVYCLGNCACGPSLKVNDEIIGRVTIERFDQLLDTLTSQPVEVK